MEAFSQGYKFYGLQFQPDNSVIVREWAPGAKDVYITGDFSEYLLFGFFFFCEKGLCGRFLELGVDVLKVVCKCSCSGMDLVSV